MRWLIGVKFCTVISTLEAKFCNAGTKFWRGLGRGPLQKIFRGQNMQNLARFRTSSNFGDNISGTDVDIQNQTITFCTTISSVFGEKSSVNFPLIMEI